MPRRCSGKTAPRAATIHHGITACRARAPDPRGRSRTRCPVCLRSALLHMYTTAWLSSLTAFLGRPSSRRASLKPRLKRCPLETHPSASHTGSSRTGHPRTLLREPWSALGATLWNLREKGSAGRGRTHELRGAPNTCPVAASRPRERAGLTCPLVARATVSRSRLCCSRLAAELLHTSPRWPSSFFHFLAIVNSDYASLKPSAGRPFRTKE